MNESASELHNNHRQLPTIEFIDLVELIQNTSLYSDLKFPQISTDDRPELKKVVESIVKAFNPRPSQERLEALKAFVKEVQDNSEGWRNIIGIKIIIQTAQNWIRILEREQQPIHGKLVAYPSLVGWETNMPDDIADGKGEQKRYVSQVQFAILNIGVHPAFEVRAELKLSGKHMRFEKLENSEAAPMIRLAIPNQIRGGTLYYTNLIEISYNKADFLELELRWEIAPDQRGGELGTKNYRSRHFLATAVSRVSQDPYLLLNPYLVNRPILSKQDEDRFLWGFSRIFVKQVLTDLQKKTPNLYIVRHVRHSGMTSVLRCIEAGREGHTRDRSLIIYINWYRWYLLFKGRSTYEVLFYEIALRILDQAVQQNVPGIDQIMARHFGKGTTTKLTMTEKELEAFLNELYQEVKSITLLMDEFQYWLWREDVTKQTPIVFSYFQEVLIQVHKIRIVVGLAWGDSEKEAALRRSLTILGIKPSLHLQFLERDDIPKLIAAGQPLQTKALQGSRKLASQQVLYTDLAKEYIWLMTGGWAGLLQLVFDRILWNISEVTAKEADGTEAMSGRDGSILVDINLVRRVINDLQSNRGMLVSFRDAFSREEKAILEEFATNHKGWFQTNTLHFREEALSLAQEHRGEGLSENLFHIGVNWSVRLEETLNRKEDPQQILGLLRDKQVIESINQPFEQDTAPAHFILRLRVGMLADKRFWGDGD